MSGKACFEKSRVVSNDREIWSNIEIDFRCFYNVGVMYNLCRIPWNGNVIQSYSVRRGCFIKFEEKIDRVDDLRRRDCRARNEMFTFYVYIVREDECIRCVRFEVHDETRTS